MEVEFAQPTVMGLLSATYQYQIPLYQRAYEWEPRQIDDLWADILSVKDSGTHFIGSVVVHKTKDKKARQVIDGQQRLITLLMLMSIIRDKYLKLGDPIRDPKEDAAPCSAAPGQLIKKVGYQTDYTVQGGKWNRIVLEDFVYRLPNDAKRRHFSSADDWKTLDSITRTKNKDLREGYLRLQIAFDKEVLKSPKRERVRAVKRLESYVVDGLSCFVLDVADLEDAFILFETPEHSGIASISGRPTQKPHPWRDRQPPPRGSKEVG